MMSKSDPPPPPSSSPKESGGLCLLIDTSSYLFRAYHAVADLHTRGGSPTGAIYGVVSMLRKLLRQYPAQFAACVMDTKEKTFRHRLFPKYKANRPPIDPELAAQIAPVGEFVRAMGFAQVAQDGLEADDLIASLVRLIRAQKITVIISSGDKDLTQLVGEGVTMVDSLREKIYDAEGVREKFGVAPPQIADYLALVGDTSDNIPGVDKVGPKTAAKWLAEFGTLDNLLAHKESISRTAGENLRIAAEKTLPLARQLVKVRGDIPLDVKLSDLIIRPPDADALAELCERYEFNFLSRILEERGVSPPPGGIGKDDIKSSDTTDDDARRRGYLMINKTSQLREWAARAQKAGRFAIDTETDSLNAIDANLIGFSLALGAGEAAYVPLAHRPPPPDESDSGDLIKEIGGESPPLPPQIQMETALQIIRPLLESGKVCKVGHNIKFDMHVFANYGIAVAEPFEDSQLLAYAEDAGAANNLDSLARRWLGMETIKFKDVIKEKKDFSEVAISEAAAYAAEDADAAHQLFSALSPRASQRAKKVYEEIDRPLAPALMRMERNGILIDSDSLNALADSFAVRMRELEKQAFDSAGEEFNLNSTKQLRELLYDKMKMPPPHKTPKGALSTDESALSRLASDYELPGIILQHRTLAKLSSTYAAKLPKMVNPRTGRVHTNFNQSAVVTGRLASSEPNLQNIPIRTEDGRRIRRAFIAPPKSSLISADYSQIELRLMAHLSGDEGLLSAFADGEDIHRRTAAEIFNVDDHQIDSEKRRFAKTINFGLMYGMSAFGLADSLGVSQAQAKDYIDRYFSRYPGVADFMEKIRREALARGYVETIFGRRIPVTASGRNAAGRRAAERAAINAPMQGGAADLIKIAMTKAQKWLDDSKLKSKILLQVHDELVLESPDSEVAILRENLPPLMSDVAELRAPLEVNIGVGNNWEEAH